jgi:hypothetical protein
MVFSFAFSTKLAAQDVYPHGGALEVRQHGYEHGYRDGFERGREEHARGGSSDFHTKEYEQADRGFEGGFGDRELFRTGYRSGYQAGYLDGFSGNTRRFNEIYGYRNRDFDADRDRATDQYDSVYTERRWGYQDVASDIAYRDGLVAGAKDATTGHSYRPREHDSWKDADHGYTKAYGDKNLYKAAYRAAYEAGYRDGFGGRR